MASEQIINKRYFEKLPVLSSDRLVLNEIQPEEAKALIEISVYDGVYAKDEAGAVQILEKINHDMAQGEALHWGIFLKNTGELTGTCGYYRGFASHRGEIGYVLHPSYRGLGIMTEAVRLIVDFGLDRLKLHAVIAYTDPANFASQAVLQRVGFKQVGSDEADLKFETRRP